jgi:hypothetical protein
MKSMTTVDLSAHICPPIAAASAADSGTSFGGDFSFGDVLDIVNPLQHIPIVSTIYRAITGDQIKTFPKIAGDALFGGMAGFVSSVADTIFEKITGKNVGDTALAWIEKEFFSPPSAIASMTRPALIAPTVQPAAVAPAVLNSVVIPSQDGLPMSVPRENVDHDLARRAANAYRSGIDITSKATSTALH